MKVGDKVILSRCEYNNRVVKIREIERETKLYWIVEGIQFKKTNLQSTSNSIGLSSWIREPNDEQEIMLIERSEKARLLAKKLSKVEWMFYDLETLESVLNIISPEKKVVEN
jgi:hypothetical protein